MAVFSIGATLINPGAERHGASKDPPDQVTAVKVSLVDTNGDWLTKTGTILKWGVQASDSGGNFANTAADWDNQGSVFQTGIAFGSTRRDGTAAPPILKIAASDADGNPVPIAPPGVKLRLAIQVDAAITLGAEIRTNADAA